MGRRGGGIGQALAERVTPKRGYVYSARLPLRDETFAYKYCVIISRNSINDSGMNVIVARITDEERYRALDTAVELDPGMANLPVRSWILCHDVLTIPQSWLDPRPKGELPLGKIIEMEPRLAYSLDLDNGPYFANPS